MLDDNLVKLKAAKDTLNLGTHARHIFICAGSDKSDCFPRKESLAAWDYLKKRIKQLNLKDKLYRTKANCLRVCTNGPILLVQPDNIWYHSCTNETIELILQEHIIGNRPVEKYII